MDPNKLNCFRGKCSHNSLTRSMLVGGPSPRLAMRPRQKVRSFVNLSIHIVWSCFSFGYDCLMLWFGKINLNIYIYICMCNYYIHLNKNACMCGWIYLSIYLSVYPSFLYLALIDVYVLLSLYAYTYMYTHICIYAYAYCNGINISALKVRYTNMPYIYIYTDWMCW